MQRKVCRFEIQDLLPIGLTLVVAGIAIVYGMNVIGDTREDYCGDDSTEHFYSNSCYVCPNSSHSTYISGTTCANQTQGVGMVNVSAVAGGSADFNASTEAVKAVGKIPEKMPLIATVIIAAVIIGILIRYLVVNYNS